MSTSKDLEPTSLTFDDIIHTNPPLFRLHSPKSSHTFFDDDSKVLIASNKVKKCKDNSEEIGLTLKDLNEKPTPHERGAVAGHITSWREGNTEPSASDFISLTHNFWFVLWEWNRRRGQSKSPRPEDDFQVIVFDSSALRTQGRAKLGTEVVDQTQNPVAYSFTQAHDEIIVADFIQPPATLGAMSLSQLQGFIPSWCREQLESEENKTLRFKSFVRNLRQLKPSTYEDDGVLQSLHFALELLAPILATGDHWHQRADNESAVDSASRNRPRDEDRTLDRSSHDHVGGLSAGEDSPRAAHPPKRRKLAGSANAEQGSKNPERFRACNYIRAILADIWYMEEMGERKALQETWTDDVDKLLKLYMETLEKYVLHACRGFHS